MRCARGYAIQSRSRSGVRNDLPLHARGGPLQLLHIPRAYACRLRQRLHTTGCLHETARETPPAREYRDYRPSGRVQAEKWRAVIARDAASFQ